MNKEKENKAIDKVEKNTDKKNVSGNKSSSRTKYNILLVVILIICLVTGYFLNNRLVKIENKISQSHVKQNNIAKGNDGQINEILSKFTSINNKLDELESKQGVLSYSLSRPVEQQIHINEDYALSEIEHLLIIASYNLQLDHNVVTALAAMEAADARLKGLSDPAVLSVREQLIADMNELRSLNQADLSGLALYLSDLINRVDGLSLKEDIVLGKPEVNNQADDIKVEGVKHYLMLVWKEFKTFFEYGNDAGKTFLLPDELYFIKANLKLELANARFAVFNRDTENLQVSIELMQGWLINYFDLSDADVSNIYDSFSSMKKIELKFPKLDINSSLESVRALSRFQNDSDNSYHEEGSALVE